MVGSPEPNVVQQHVAGVDSDGDLGLLGHVLFRASSARVDVRHHCVRVRARVCCVCVCVCVCERERMRVYVCM